MRGDMPSPPYQQVTWSVYGTPDNTGAFSGFGAGYLENIAIDYEVYDNGQGPVAQPICYIPTGQVGGDLSGSLPDPTVVGLQTYPIKAITPTSNQILEFVDGYWTPTNLPSPITYVTMNGDVIGLSNASTVVKLQNYAISSTAPSDGYALIFNGTAWAPTAISGSPTGPASGDLSGTYPSPLVTGLYGTPIANTSPIIGDALVFNGTAYSPAPAAGTDSADDFLLMGA